MTHRIIRLAVLATAAALLPLAATGCGTSVAQWIVRTRDHQGDVSIAHGNYPDASVAYQLALKIDPTNAHARVGLATVQLRLAQTYYAASKFDDAIDALAIAAHYTPDDERIAGLRNEIEQAELKRDIVVSNYPSYAYTGSALRRGYLQLKTQDQEVLNALHRFDYTYDTADLSAALRQSDVLEEDLVRLRTRLAQYRQLVESGVPEQGGEDLAPPASLLPLP
jgi:tetratricopeptide (TPR) repeat protein